MTNQQNGTLYGNIFMLVDFVGFCVRDGGEKAIPV